MNYQKNREIEGVRANLEQNNREIEDIRANLIPKDKEIESLKSDLLTKDKQIDDMKEKIDSFKAEKSELSRAPEIIERIKETMELKGFLSDRELEDLLK